MDDSRFDALARRLSDARPRRPLLGAGLTALAALGTGLTWSSEADAKKKKKKKKKKSGSTTPPPTTRPPVTCLNGQPLCDGKCCPTGQSCNNGACRCNGSNKINCGDRCCNSLTEICHVSEGGVTTCQEGVCQANNACAGGGFSFCRNDAGGTCLCGSTVAPAQTVCFKAAAVNCSQTCTTNADCGGGSVCIPGGPACTCQTSFCAQLCDN